MRAVSNAVREGHYARKQIFCRDWLISWSHRSRFEIGLELAREFAGKRVLDYGCGDGTFLGMLMASSAAPAEAVGVEVDGAVVEDCRQRLGQQGMRFIKLDELDASHPDGMFDGIICMEVLEHMLEVDSILETFERMLAPNGKVLISVPVETGLPLLVKQTMRRIAGWRGVADYPGTSSYTLGEYWASLFADSKKQIERPIHGGADGHGIHDHKGFNWMAFRELLSRRFRIERMLSSPITWLTPHLASQVWFIVQKNARTP